MVSANHGCKTTTTITMILLALNAVLMLLGLVLGVLVLYELKDINHHNGRIGDGQKEIIRLLNGGRG